MTSLWMTLPFLLVLLGVSAFFSGSETALFSLQRETLAAFRTDPRKSARRVVELLETPRDLLATILFGNLVVNTLFYSTTALLAYDLAQRGAAVSAAAVGAGGLVAVIIFGEVVPKAASLAHRRRLSLFYSGGIVAVYHVLRPVRHLVGPLVRVLTNAALRVTGPPRRITREELSMLVELTREQGHIPPQEGEMIEDVMGLNETRLREVMVPRVDMVAIPEGSSLEDLIDVFCRTGRRKIPVYSEDLDHIRGIAYVKRAILRPASSLDDVTDKCVFVPETKTTESLLSQFRDTKTKMAVVVDEYGGTAGLVTLSDLVGEIVGPIGNEYTQPEQLVEELADGVYRLAGDLSIREWNELFHMDLESERLSTLGGFVVFLLGHVPRRGDTTVYQNVRFTVEKMARHRIISLRAELLDPNANGPATGEEGS